MKVGIDLGSQTSRVSCYVEGRVSEPSKIPSLVALTDQFLVGREAARELETRHCNMIRHLTAGLRTRRKFKLSHRKGDKEIGIELAFVMILEKLKKTAEAHGPIKSCAIAIPAALSALEVERLRSAALAVGLKGVHFIPSPLAVAVHFAKSPLLKPSVKPQTLLVVDVGCRFTSASIVHVNRGNVELVATKALRMGGHDIDQAILRLVPDLPIDVCHPAMAQAAVEKAKKDLASLREAVVEIKQKKTTVTRAQLDRASAPLLHKLRIILSKLTAAHPDVCLALLVGGAGRMIRVRELVSSGGDRGLCIPLEVMDYDFSCVQGCVRWIESLDPQVPPHLPSSRSSPFRFWTRDPNLKAPRLMFDAGSKDWIKEGSRWMYQQLLVDDENEPSRQPASMLVEKPVAGKAPTTRSNNNNPENLPSPSLEEFEASHENAVPLPAIDVPLDGFLPSDDGLLTAIYDITDVPPGTEFRLRLEATPFSKAGKMWKSVSPLVLDSNGVQLLKEEMNVVRAERKMVEEMAEKRNFLEEASLRAEDYEADVIEEVMGNVQDYIDLANKWLTDDDAADQATMQDFDVLTELLHLVCDESEGESEGNGQIKMTILQQQIGRHFLTDAPRLNTVKFDGSLRLDSFDGFDSTGMWGSTHVTRVPGSQKLNQSQRIQPISESSADRLGLPTAYERGMKSPRIAPLRSPSTAGLLSEKEEWHLTVSGNGNRGKSPKSPRRGRSGSFLLSPTEDRTDRSRSPCRSPRFSRQGSHLSSPSDGMVRSKSPRRNFSEGDDGRSQAGHSPRTPLDESINVLTSTFLSVSSERKPSHSPRNPRVESLLVADILGPDRRRSRSPAKPRNELFEEAGAPAFGLDKAAPRRGSNAGSLNNDDMPKLGSGEGAAAILDEASQLVSDLREKLIRKESMDAKVAEQAAREKQARKQSLDAKAAAQAEQAQAEAERLQQENLAAAAAAQAEAEREEKARKESLDAKAAAEAEAESEKRARKESLDTKLAAEAERAQKEKEKQEKEELEKKEQARLQHESEQKKKKEKEEQARVEQEKEEKKKKVKQEKKEKERQAKKEQEQLEQEKKASEERAQKEEDRQREKKKKSDPAEAEIAREDAKTDEKNGQASEKSPTKVPKRDEADRGRTRARSAKREPTDGEGGSPTNHTASEDGGDGELLTNKKQRSQSFRRRTIEQPTASSAARRQNERPAPLKLEKEAPEHELKQTPSSCSSTRRRNFAEHTTASRAKLEDHPVSPAVGTSGRRRSVIDRERDAHRRSGGTDEADGGSPTKGLREKSMSSPSFTSSPPSRKNEKARSSTHERPAARDYTSSLVHSPGVDSATTASFTDTLQRGRSVSMVQSPQSPQPKVPKIASSRGSLRHTASYAAPFAIPKASSTIEHETSPPPRLQPAASSSSTKASAPVYSSPPREQVDPSNFPNIPLTISTHDIGPYGDMRSNSSEDEDEDSARTKSTHSLTSILNLTGKQADLRRDDEDTDETLEHSHAHLADSRRNIERFFAPKSEEDQAAQSCTRKTSGDPNMVERRELETAPRPAKPTITPALVRSPVGGYERRDPNKLSCRGDVTLPAESKPNRKRSNTSLKADLAEPPTSSLMARSQGPLGLSAGAISVPGTKRSSSRRETSPGRKKDRAAASMHNITLQIDEPKDASAKTRERRLSSSDGLTLPLHAVSSFSKRSASRDVQPDGLSRRSATQTFLGGSPSRSSRAVSVGKHDSPVETHGRKGYTANDLEGSLRKSRAGLSNVFSPTASSFSGTESSKQFSRNPTAPQGGGASAKSKKRHAAATADDDQLRKPSFTLSPPPTSMRLSGTHSRPERAADPTPPATIAQLNSSGKFNRMLSPQCSDASLTRRESNEDVALVPEVKFISGGGEVVEFCAGEGRFVNLKVNGVKLLSAVALKYDAKRSQLIAYQEGDTRGTGGQVPSKGRKEFVARLAAVAASVGVECRGFGSAAVKAKEALAAQQNKQFNLSTASLYSAFSDTQGSLPDEKARSHAVLDGFTTEKE